jgi:cytochrome c-type biogenesis protein CcmH/NrfG
MDYYLLVKIVIFAVIVALLYFMMRRRKPANNQRISELQARANELTIQGVSEEDAQKQAMAELRTKMLARQKKVSIYMGAIWIMFGLVFYAQSKTLDVTTIALVTLGAIQVLTGLFIKPAKK